MNDPDPPLVSVCIPTYQRADLLRRAVASILGGEYRNVEIVISDNGSRDGTRQVGEELARADPRVRYFRHAENRGPTWNFEFARAQARGRYFLWHGDDDYLAPDFVPLCVEELERDAGLVLVAGLGAYHAGDGLVTRYGNVIQGALRHPWLRVFKYLLLVDENSLFCGVYRRDAVAPCSMPNMLAGDWAWVADVLAMGRAKVLSQTHCFREQGGENTSASLERIVAVHGLPPWHARRAWLAIPLNLANHLAFHSAMARGRAKPVRVLLWAAVASTALLRQALVAVLSRTRFAGALRRLLTEQRGSG